MSKRTWDPLTPDSLVQTIGVGDIAIAKDVCINEPFDTEEFQNYDIPTAKRLKVLGSYKIIVKELYFDVCFKFRALLPNFTRMMFQYQVLFSNYLTEAVAMRAVRLRIQNHHSLYRMKVKKTAVRLLDQMLKVLILMNCWMM